MTDQNTAPALPLPATPGAAMLPPAARQRRRGSAIVEMAVMLPVLVLMFVGMAEFGIYIRAKSQLGVVANQVAGALYALNAKDLGNRSVIDAIMAEIPNLSKPYPTPKVSVSFCEWDAKTGKLYRDFYTANTPAAINVGCGQAPTCGGGVTKTGYGAYVQVTACGKFTPVVTGKIFKDALHVENTSYLPLTDVNQTKMLVALSGGEREEVNPDGPITPPDPPVPCVGEGCDAPEPNPDKCTITQCPLGQHVEGEGAACQCVGNSLCEIQPVCLEGQTFRAETCSCTFSPICPPGTTPSLIGPGGDIVYCIVPGAPDPDFCDISRGFQWKMGACVIPATCPDGTEQDASDGQCSTTCGGTNPGCDTSEKYWSEQSCSCEYKPCPNPSHKRYNGICQPICNPDLGLIPDGAGGCKSMCTTGVWDPQSRECTVPDDENCVQKNAWGTCIEWR